MVVDDERENHWMMVIDENEAGRDEEKTLLHA